MNSNEMYQVVTKIQRTSGLNQKKAILSGFPDMQNILRTTYDPFTQFGVSPTDDWITEPGEECFSSKTNDILTRLADGSLSGNAARSRIKNHLKELSYDSGRLLIMILNKSFNFGLARKSINEVFSGLVPSHPIQLAKPFRLDKCYFPCLASPKLDGLRAVYRDGKFYSRQGHIFCGLQVLETEMRDLFSYMPPGTKLDGELMVDGEHFNEISGKIRAFTEADHAHYYIFDIPSYEAYQYKRIMALDAISLKSNYPHITFVQHATILSMDNLMCYHGKCIEDGYEGTMVKQEKGMYQDARTWDWMKLKNTETADCTVVSVFEGTGKYVGMAGGVVVNYNGRTVRVGSGLSDSQRMYWWNDPDEIIGRTIEVAYQEETPDGSLRHPRFKCVRGDK